MKPPQKNRNITLSSWVTFLEVKSVPYLKKSVEKSAPKVNQCLFLLGDKLEQYVCRDTKCYYWFGPMRLSSRHLTPRVYLKLILKTVNSWCVFPPFGTRAIKHRDFLTPADVVVTWLLFYRRLWACLCSRLILCLTTYITQPGLVITAKILPKWCTYIKDLRIWRHSLRIELWCCDHWNIMLLA